VAAIHLPELRFRRPWISGDVKNRDFSTTSERELIVAMASSGRTMTLAALAGWRKEGLLPPLASHGLGTGKGKSYYWRDPDIVAHAKAAYDCLRKYGRPETAVWMLWMSGFSVPLPQFRRVWAYRSRSRKFWATHATGVGRRTDYPGMASHFPSAPEGGSADLLLKTILAFGGALVPDDGDSAAIIAVIERAYALVLRSNDLSAKESEHTAARLWPVIRIVSAALEASDLVSIASDAELHLAQEYLAMAGPLLRRCCDQPPDEFAPGLWPSWLAERMAAPLFLLILVLLRSGHEAILEQMAARIERTDRPIRLPSIQHSHTAA
jgi:hypothetical protein